MRALSIPQPWAALVIRGVKTVEVRSWRPKEKGPLRIAIHASANFELDKVERLWHDDSGVARVFADQGWMGRDDIRALPRSAVIGTVELRGVHAAQAVRAARVDPSRKDWIGEALENAVRDPISGHLRAGSAPARTLAVGIPAKGWVFGFAKALEVKPIHDVRGFQHLWEVPASLAEEIAGREAAARSGEWQPRVASREAVQASLALWRERFETNEARYAWRLMREAVYETINDTLELEDEGAERMLRRAMDAWRKAHGETGADGREYIRVPKRLKSLFAGESRVLAERFESDVRVLILEKELKDRRYAAYREVAERVRELVREGLARAEESPSSREALEKEAKALFKSGFWAAEEYLELTDRVVEIPDY